MVLNKRPVFIGKIGVSGMILPVNGRCGINFSVNGLAVILIYPSEETQKSCCTALYTSSIKNANLISIP